MTESSLPPELRIMAILDCVYLDGVRERREREKAASDLYFKLQNFSDSMSKKIAHLKNLAETTKEEMKIAVTEKILKIENTIKREKEWRGSTEKIIKEMNDEFFNLQKNYAEEYLRLNKVLREQHSERHRSEINKLLNEFDIRVTTELDRINKNCEM